MVGFTRLDYPVWLLLETSYCLDSNPCLLILGLVLLHCNHLWALLCIGLRFVVIGRSFALRPFLILTAPPLISEHFLIFASIACVAALELLLSSGKPDDPVWYSGLSDFPAWSAVGQHLRNNRLLCGNLHGQNLKLVLTILGETTSAAEPMVCSTPPMVDKVDTSSTEAPTA
jgi:hypothetical protein